MCNNPNWENVSKITHEIKTILEDIDFDITKGRLYGYNVDDIRTAYLKTEIDTLLFIYGALESKAYKESFIMLRSVFEKFLYFWLMLSGKKYRWTTYFQIQTSEIVGQSRDDIYHRWRIDWKSGNSAFKNVKDIQKRGKK